jgi:hypothetical protein
MDDIIRLQGPLWRHNALTRYQDALNKYSYCRTRLLDDIAGFRYETIEDIKSTWTFEVLERIQTRWDELGLKERLRHVKFLSEDVKLELNPKGEVYKAVVEEIRALETSLISLKKSHIKALLQSVITTLQDVHSQPKYLIEMAKKSGLPDKAFQDSTLNQVYKDALRDEWIQFPIGIEDTQKRFRYYCALHLMQHLDETKEDQPFKLTSNTPPLELDNFRWVKQDNAYFSNLHYYLKILQDYLSHIQQSKRDLKALIQSTKINFSFEKYQPRWIIKEAIRTKDLSEEQLKKSPHLSTQFLDPMTQQWIRFPIRRTIQDNNQIKYEYYCASTLESLLEKCADTEPLTLLENKQSTFQAVSTRGPYLSLLSRYLNDYYAYQHKLYKSVSLNSFLSFSSSDSNASIAQQASSQALQSSEETSNEDLVVKISLG